MLIKGQTRKTMRQLLEKGPVFAPCVYDCTSAKIIEQAGFEAMSFSGSEMARSRSGLPDIGLTTLDELVSVVERISDVCALPMLVDIDTGFGNEFSVMRTCERIARAGAMAVHLEDQVFPKRCGHLGGKEVVSRDEYLNRIKAAHEVLKHTDCLLTARTDAYHVLGKDEAIARAKLALEAGADMTYIEAVNTLEGMEEIGRTVPGWKFFGMISYGACPKVSFKQLVDWGFNYVSFHCTMMGAVTGMVNYAKKCLDGKKDCYSLEHGGDYSAHTGTLTNLAEWMETASLY